MVLAAGMIGLLVLGLFAHTGSMPPLVVVESSSMIHELNGEVGSIDAGDLVLVHNQPMDTVTTFAEASNPNHPQYGYEQHGMAGDVIIYDKNGEGGTPIIHRAILEVVQTSSRSQIAMLLQTICPLFIAPMEERTMTSFLPPMACLVPAS
jgi:signal peptidase I